jgi:hypothetical protein
MVGPNAPEVVFEHAIGDGSSDDADLEPTVEAAVPQSCARLERPGDDEFDRILKEAAYLLNYAVEAGIEVEADVAKRIIAATRLGPTAWDSPDAGDLTAAVTKLAAKLHPVTAETLRACREEAHDWIRYYRRFVYWLAGFIIPLSVISFIWTGISNTITADLKTANDLLVTLHTQFDPTSAAVDPAPPSGSLSELQQFAVAMRAIYWRTRQLNGLIFFLHWDPDQDKDKEKQLEITPDLKYSMEAMRAEVNRMTPIYQNVRLYATNVQDWTTVIWGAIGNCILPLLYALLGACASVLRVFTVQLEARTFAPSYATPARFIIAGIGGGVVGLFNNFSIGQGVSLPPLALAFLVGYAADIFFSFLEGSMPNLSKAKLR